MKNKKGLLTVAMVGALVLGGLSISTKSYANTAANQQKIITSEEANKIALSQTNNGKILKTELDTEKGFLVYEIKVLDGNIKREFEIDAATGNILEIDNERTFINVNNAQTTNTNTATTGNNISIDDAKKIALDNSKNGKIKSIEFDYKNGIPVYEVEVAEGFMEKEFLIDATNGNILRTKKDF